MICFIKYACVRLKKINLKTEIFPEIFPEIPRHLIFGIRYQRLFIILRPSYKQQKVCNAYLGYNGAAKPAIGIVVNLYWIQRIQIFDISSSRIKMFLIFEVTD